MDSSTSTRIKRLEERIEYLEGVNRQTTEALRLATRIGHFETSMSQLDTNEAILRETCNRAHRLLPCKAMSVFLFDEQTADLELAHCQPQEQEDRLRAELEFLVESRTLAWALDRNAAYLAPSHTGEENIMLHPLATSSRIRGVFLGVLEQDSCDVPDSMRLLFSIIMQSSANSLESFALYHLLQDVNISLEDKVQRLAASEETVTRSRDWLQTIFDVIPVGVNIINRDYDILEISEKLLGYYKVRNRQQLRNKKCYRLLKNRNSPCPECSMPHVLATGSILDRFSSEEEEAITGRSFKIFSVPMLDKSGALQAVAEFHLDVSDLRQLEQALIAARDEAQHANKAKSDFLASVSHEIRTPMNAIIGMSELALGNDTDPQQREFLETILDSSTHLLMLINDILDFSKIEARKLELERMDFDLHETMQSLIRTLQPQAEAAGIALDLNISANALRSARGDPGRLRQILLNLMGNALKFTTKGTVRLTVEPAPAGMTRPSERAQWLLFSVQDEGIGIPFEKQHEVFNEFYQAHSSLDRRYGGTGLGLSITRLLVNLMGGRIWLESAPDQGSTFYVLLPVQHGSLQAIEQDKNDAEDATSQQPAVKHAPLQILLAEDNKVNARVATLFLERHGHEIIHALNGHEVLACLRQQQFDVVLMDLEMPGMDGLEAAIRIRSGEAGSKASEVRIVAMTAHAVAGYREKCLEAGMNGFLTKPVNFQALLGILTDATQEPTQKGTFSNRDAQPILDLRQCLNRIGGDTEIMEDVLDTFLADLPKKVELLYSLKSQDELETFRQVSHAVKGSAGTVGAQRLSAVAADLEQAVTNGAPADLEELLEQLEVEVENVRKALADKDLCKN